MNIHQTLQTSRQSAIGQTLLTMQGMETPAFVYDEQGLHDICVELEAAGDAAGCVPLFAMKSFSHSDALRTIVPPLNGLATSSLYESRLARKVLEQDGKATDTVHLTSPGMSKGDVEELAVLCDYVSFNSLTQAENLIPVFRKQKEQHSDECKLGLRINPQISFIEDHRYDPCRKHSKLGVSFDQLNDLLDLSPAKLAAISGVHVHSNCESNDLNELKRTVEHVENKLGFWLAHLDWINLGGGYDFTTDVDTFSAITQNLKERYNVKVFIEPGASISRPNGYIVSSVMDIFKADGKEIAVLDTTVNHMPEVFEYQFEPDVVGDHYSGRYEYILAGCTCLAGDVFGLYGFDTRLDIGSKVVFQDMGAYTLVKSHFFNGVKLPNTYALTSNNKLVLKSQCCFDDFARLCGG